MSREVSASGSAILRSPLLRLAPSGPGDSRLPDLVGALLREQQTIVAQQAPRTETAVDLFARKHAACDVDQGARAYREVLPLQRPKPGEQYAFEVDLDACTGCKACVAACHSLNDLDEGEVWRTVGLLHGGTAEAPAQQTVTTSCHHCVDPACMSGCPVKAYEKDPVTGIVRHLDDQCIGCQYCTFMCPYDAPKYNAARGIVRKCDMCSDRLASGEGPACVQSCPSLAIKICVIDQKMAIEASEAGTFLPGAPAPDHTIPTTIYRSARQVPRNLLPADYYSVHPEHGHLPLVFMLVLTQLSVGAFAVHSVVGRAVESSQSRPSLPHALGALLMAVLAITAATLHLGRPMFAWRAVLGLRTSWMSREILAFGLFAKAASLFALALVPASTLPGFLRGFPGRAFIAERVVLWEIAALVTGILGVFFSVMIYAATRRMHWRAAITGPKFFATTVALGSAATLALSSFSTGVTSGYGRALLALVVVVGGGKLLAEAFALRHVRDRQHTVGKRVALIMVQDLRAATAWRFLLGGAGAVALPLAAWSSGRSPQSAMAAAMTACLLGGELLERYLFFKAAPPSRMPGALG